MSKNVFSDILGCPGVKFNITLLPTSVRVSDLWLHTGKRLSWDPCTALKRKETIRRF